MKSILVLGANGQLGRQIVRAAVRSGNPVTAFVRKVVDPVFENNVHTFIGDATNLQQLINAVRGHDVVVNAIGSGTIRKNIVESITTKIVLEAVQKVGARRYVAMSAGMVAVDTVLIKILRSSLLKNLYHEHRRVEALVSATSLDWTIVRPPRLTNDSSRGYKASVDVAPQGMWSTPRADVAEFVITAVNSNAYIRKAVFVA